MSRYACRCRKCERRRILRQAPEHYEPARLPRCQCGAKDWRIDRWAHVTRDTHKEACFGCGGYWFPHRMGSLYCHHRKDGTPRIIGDADFRDRQMSDQDVIDYLTQCQQQERQAA